MGLPALYELTAQHRELERLAVDGEIDEATLRDTLEGLEGNIQEKGASVAAMVANLDAWANTVSDAAERLATRANAMRNRAVWLKGYLLVNMTACGISKIETAELVASIRKNPASVQIVDGAVLPERFMVPAPPPPPARPDKKLIAAALKAGEDVPGCSLVSTERLDIR